MALLNTFADLFANSETMLVALLIFLATATVAFVVMATVRVRGAVKRRASGISEEAGEQGRSEGGSLRKSGKRTVQRLLDYTNKHYSGTDSKDLKALRRRLIQAGIFDPRGVAYFFLARTVLAVTLGFGTFVLLPAFVSVEGATLWLLVGAGGLFGYLAPGIYLDRRIKARRYEYRSGFPDFLDLLVVCADSGLSMEAALERVGREIGDSYPALCANIHMANLEMRAGRTMTDALEQLSERLGLPEARSFTTLIQQSQELGSSITDALRIYSDDMRHQRLSRAEEKAYSLPAKLAVPMMICIFPTIFVVILLPVVVRLVVGMY